MRVVGVLVRACGVLVRARGVLASWGFRHMGVNIGAGERLEAAVMALWRSAK